MTSPGSTAGLPLLSILIFAPLVVAAVATLIRSERRLRWWTLAGTTAIALCSLTLWTGFTAGTADFQFVEHAAWIPWLKINYTVGLDGISLLLVLLTTLLSPLCVLCSWNNIKTRVREFMLCLLIMETAMVALIALRLHTGTFYIPDLMGRPYDPVFQCWIFAAFFISFAIKVPMFPFHTWLPAAHVEAPTAGSVLLASVLLKMGTYGFLRFCLPITPYGTHVFAPYVLWLSVVSILYGGFAALTQGDLKKLVAYSSVGHMGFATLGIFALNTRGLEGATLVMINHGITTGALFLAVGMIYERLHTRDLAAAAGLGRFMPVFTFFLGVFCLSSLALPGTNSFIGEFPVLSGGFSVSLVLVACTCLLYTSD